MIVLKINDRQVERLLKEVLKKTDFSDPVDYISARIEADHQHLRINRRLL